MPENDSQEKVAIAPSDERRGLSVHDARLHQQQRIGTKDV
jgi:hypothetical protein